MVDIGKMSPSSSVAPRPMRRWTLPFVLLAALAAIVWLVFETRRLAEIVGTRDIELRALRHEHEATTARLATESASRAAAASDAARLAGELATATTQLQGMTEVLATSRAEFARARADSEAAERRRAAPMPEGVRTCLASLHECLRAEGFANQRFVHARALDAEGLHDVEMYQLDDDRLGITFVMAGRMTAELDRAKNRLVLKFFDGHRVIGSAREEIAADGFLIAFEPVDGRLLEQRLPYLIRASGEYRATAAKATSSDVDPLTRRQWLERLDTVLDAAGTEQSLRITRFRGMADGGFLEAELIGTDDRHRVLSSAHCARIAIEVDRTANVVSLLLQSGVLRNGGIESTISADGYRMLLPKLDCKRATDLMFGMVVSK